MEQKKKMKLCANCDGQVDIDLRMCPYCGNVFSFPPQMETKVEISPLRRETTPPPLSPEETLASLYPPPYQPRVSEPIVEKEKTPLVKEEALQVKEGAKQTLWPILAFSLGLNLLLLGLLTFFFSHEGSVVLRWDSHFWFIYFLLSAPLIYFGYRGILQKFSE